jgi:hypothetical protein
MLTGYVPTTIRKPRTGAYSISNSYAKMIKNNYLCSHENNDLSSIAPLVWE